MKKTTKFFQQLKEVLKFLIREIKKIIIFCVVFILIAKIIIFIDVNGLLFGTSKLAVATEPSGAKIFINGKHKGKSPTRNGYGINIQIHAGNNTVEAIIPSDGPREKYASEENVFVAEDGMEFITLKLHDRVNADFKKKFQSKYGEAIPEPTMVSIPSGRFIMGAKDGYSDEKPPHEVTLSPFKMSATEITFDQYDACVISGGCDHCPDDNGWGRADRPVIDVSWNDAQQYIGWLNQQTGKEYRLPTEAEWEYAARAGSTHKYSWGNEIGTNQANCDGCGCQWDEKQTAPVESFTANAFGLFDMHGNVREWCQDWYYDKYYDYSTTRDPQGFSAGQYHVVRGGGWFFSPERLNSAGRDWQVPEDRFDIGFRLVLSEDKTRLVHSPLYVGRQDQAPECSAELAKEDEPLELWFESIANGLVRGWLRSNGIVGRISGTSLDSLRVSWPTYDTEKVSGETSLELVDTGGKLHAVLGGNESSTETAPYHSGRLMFTLTPCVDDYTPWLARTENDYLVQKNLSEARFCREQKNFPQARASYEKALELKKLLGLEQSLAAAEIMAPLADLSFQMKGYAAAKEYGRRSLKIRRRLQGESDRVVLVRTLRLAFYHKVLHEYHEAKELLLQGLAAIESTSTKEEKRDFQEQLADVDRLLNEANASKQHQDQDTVYDLGHSAVTLAIRDGDSAKAVRLIEESPDSFWLVVWKVFHEVADPGKKVTILGEEEATFPYPLLAAVAAMGNESVARALLSKGAQVNDRLPDGSTTLMFAAKMGHLTMVRLLLDAGADPELITQTKWSTDALGYALQYAPPGAAEHVALELIQAAQDGSWTQINNIPVIGQIRIHLNYTPHKHKEALETAAYLGLSQVVRRLADMGAPLFERDKLGATLLHYALMGSQKEVAIFLIEQGADVNEYYATDQQLKAAIVGKFKPNDQREGKTPLLLAIEEGADVEFIEQLLKSGADANLCSLSGVSPLQTAISKERKALIGLLKSYAAD